MASRVKRSMEERSFKFRTYSDKFRKGMITGAQNAICRQISPKWKIISAKTARNLPKLRESCAPQHRNFLVGLITLVNTFIIAWIDYCNSLLAGCGQQQIDKLQRVMNCDVQPESSTTAVGEIIAHCSGITSTGCAYGSTGADFVQL